MLNNILFSTICILITSLGYSQYYYIPYLNDPGNPGLYNTQISIPAVNSNPGASDLVGSGWTLIQDSSATPTWSTIQNLPFAFEFNGQQVSQYKVSTTGILTFDVNSTSMAPDTIPENLPSSQIPNKSICIWGINGTGSNDAIVTKTFGTAPYQEHWVFFASFSLGTGYTYWSIMLEGGSNDIYIVDQRQQSATVSSGLTLGIQVNSSIAVDVYGSPNVQPLSSGTASSYDDNYYHFMHGLQPAYDLAMKTNELPQYQWIGNAPIIVTGTLENFGSDTVTSFDINYSTNGGAASTQNISGMNIPPYTTYSFTHPMGWTPASAGTYIMDLYATNINGNPDLNNINDTITKSFEVLDTLIPRNVLHEVFTSSTCNPCKLGNEILDSILYDNPNKWTCIKYQMDIPGVGDPYYTHEVGARSSFYNFSGIPRLFLDGGYAANPQGYNQGDMILYHNIPSFVSIEGTYELSVQTVTIDANFMPIMDYPSSSIKAFIGIVEHTTYNNVKTNGETQFEYVMKKMVPDENGIAIAPLQNGQSIHINEAYTFQGAYVLPTDASSPVDHSIQHAVEDFNHLLAVVFLQDTITKEIHQSKFIGNPCFWQNTNANFTVTTNGLTANFINQSLITGNTTYYWDFGDLGISTDENPIYSYPSSGTYNACLVIQDSCNADTFCQAVTVNSTPLPSNQELDVSQLYNLNIFPNPASQILYYKFLLNRSSEIELTIFNSLGKAIYIEPKGILANGNHKGILDFQEYPKGLYFIQLQTNNQTICKKVLYNGE